MENPFSHKSEEPEVPPAAPPEIDAVRRSSIRTLHSDVASSVRDNNMSITQIALAQQKKNASLPFVADEEKHFWSAWSIGTILLVLAGFAVIFGAIFVVVSKNVSLPFMNNGPLAPTLVPVIGRVTADVTRMPRAELIRTIETFTNSDYTSPIALEALILEEMVTTTPTEGEPISVLAPLSLEPFLERIDSRAPGLLLRSVGPDMTLGRAGSTPFLITLTASYEAAFAGMLEWEPFMADDLPFITKQLTTNSSQPTAQIETSTSSSASTTLTGAGATSTSSTTPVVVLPPPPEPEWKDIIVKNKDVRALVAHDGTVLLLYAFPKDTLLVIAQTREAFTLVVDALNAPVFGM